MPEGKDPDDYIKQGGKASMLKLLKKKEIIQSFIWNFYLSKIDKRNPYEISKFEKEIKKLSYRIQDETLKKYVLEDFLEKIKNLTPNQSYIKNYNHSKFKNVKNFKVLKETRILHQKRKDLSKLQIIEFSILFLILNYTDIASEKIEDLNDLEFLSQKNQDLKTIILSYISDDNQNAIKTEITNDYKALVEEIKENTNIQIITKDKSQQEVLNLLEDLIFDFKEQNNLKKIESLEKKLINNMDENSYSELIRLKNQINRD